MVFLWLAGRRGACLPRPEERSRCLVGQEDQPAEHGALDGETGRARGASNAVFVARRRERDRSVRRQRVDADRGAADGATVLPHGTRSALLRCHCSALREVHWDKSGANSRDEAGCSVIDLAAPHFAGSSTQPRWNYHMHDDDAKNSLNPTSLSVPDVARLLTRVGGQSISVQMIEADLASGAPANGDGTLNIVQYAAWLVRGMASGD